MTADERAPVDVAAELRRLLDERTPGRWRLWDMDIMAGPENSADYDDAVLVAETYSPDREKPRTFNAALIVAAVNALPMLLDEVDAARARIARVRALADEWLEPGAPFFWPGGAMKIRAALAGDDA